MPGGVLLGRLVVHTWCAIVIREAMSTRFRSFASRCLSRRKRKKSHDQHCPRSVMKCIHKCSNLPNVDKGGSALDAENFWGPSPGIPSPR